MDYSTGKDKKGKPRHLSLAVLYRCNGTVCDIKDEDKIKESSYFVFFGYRGFELNHQSPKKPIKPLEEEHFYVQII